MGWADVDHWLWPAFTERWGAWRQDTLGLPPLCFDTDPAGGPPLLPPLLPPPLPPAPPLLYAMSELVTPRPGYWPPSVRMAGVFAPPPQVWFTFNRFRAQFCTLGHLTIWSLNAVKY